uniref:Uncharacterized protein n=1 Tax=Anguilla anguilla TaxID=7936 RepID=A0A0E9PWS0_ANGAN
MLYIFKKYFEEKIQIFLYEENVPTFLGCVCECVRTCILKPEYFLSVLYN